MIVVNMPKRNKSSDLTDKQVLILISDHQHQEPCIEDLLNFANKEMYGYKWDKDKIRNSINRLEAKGRILTRDVVRERKRCRVPYLA